MKNKILIIFVLASLSLAGCSMLPPKESAKQSENKNKQKLLFTSQINQLLKKDAAIQEIGNPNLTLPQDVSAGQIKKYFKMDNILYALVLRNSINVVLSLPDGFIPTFAGVLVAKQGDVQWTKLLEIKDVEAVNKNNPYYLMVDNQRLLLTIVDQNGTGSGEGIMKVFALSEANEKNKNEWHIA